MYIRAFKTQNFFAAYAVWHAHKKLGNPFKAWFCHVFVFGCMNYINKIIGNLLLNIHVLYTIFLQQNMMTMCRRIPIIGRCICMLMLLNEVKNLTHSGRIVGKHRYCHNVITKCSSSIYWYTFKRVEWEKKWECIFGTRRSCCHFVWPSHAVPLKWFEYIMDSTLKMKKHCWNVNAYVFIGQLQYVCLFTFLPFQVLVLFICQAFLWFYSLKYLHILVAAFLHLKRSICYWQVHNFCWVWWWHCRADRVLQWHATFIFETPWVFKLE